MVYIYYSERGNKNEVFKNFVIGFLLLSVSLLSSCSLLQNTKEELSKTNQAIEITQEEKKNVSSKDINVKTFHSKQSYHRDWQVLEELESGVNNWLNNSDVLILKIDYKYAAFHTGSGSKSNAIFCCIIYKNKENNQGKTNS